MNALNPQLYYFEDDGIIPNSMYPLLVYSQVFTEKGEKGKKWLKATFAENDWNNSWSGGIYPYHHYHTNTHEVLGVFAGAALLQLGGENGKRLNVNEGDILIIPAGVGHKCISNSRDFAVVGAYPAAIEPDLIPEEAERPADVLDRIKSVKLPKADPYTGKQDGLTKLWY